MRRTIEPIKLISIDIPDYASPLKAYVMENEETSTIQGFIITHKDRVLALYADDEGTAHFLMQRFLLSTSFKKVQNSH